MSNNGSSSSSSSGKGFPLARVYATMAAEKKPPITKPHPQQPRRAASSSQGGNLTASTHARYSCSASYPDGGSNEKKQ